MFDKLKERVRHWMQKTGAETGLAKEFKDIFEVGGVPAFNQFYYFGILFSLCCNSFQHLDKILQYLK